MSSAHVIGTWIRDRARLTPDRAAIVFGERTVSYAELDSASAGLAAELGGRGLARGDRVAVLADNGPEYAALLFACARAGLIMTPLNWRLTAHELAFQLDHSGAGLLVASEGRMGQTADALAVAANRPPIRPMEEPAPPGPAAGRRARSSPTPTASGRTSRSIT